MAEATVWRRTLQTSEPRQRSNRYPTEAKRQELSSGTTLSDKYPCPPGIGMLTLPSVTFVEDAEEEGLGGLRAVSPSSRVLAPRPYDREPVAVEMFGFGPPKAPNDVVAWYDDDDEDWVWTDGAGVLVPAFRATITCSPFLMPTLSVLSRVLGSIESRGMVLGG